MIILTRAELAEELGVSQPRISQLVAEGLPVREDRRIDLKAACEWVVERGDYQGSVAYRSARTWLFTLNYEPRTAKAEPDA